MTVFHPHDDGHADLSSHDSFVRGAPYNTFARLRRDEPMAWCEHSGGHQGFWSVTRHADILALNRDTALLSSAHGIRMEDQTEEEVEARRTFQETDPPAHSRVRMKLMQAFMRQTVQQFDGPIRALCDEILDQALPLREFDAAHQVARALPMRMLGRIIGVPDEDLDWLVEKGDALIANTDPDFTTHVLDKADTDAFRLLPFRSPAGAELADYASALMERQRASGDTASVLHLMLKPDENGDVISNDEFRNFFCLLVAAGNDTTRYSIAAALHALALRPALLEQLRRGSSALWDAAPDEFIRWASPAMYFRRTAMRDFELHGRLVRAGQKVLFWFVSGNRDETAFPQPYELDLARTPNRHLAFGQGGPHVCLGMWLARMELRLLLRAVVQRVRRIELAGEPQWLRSNFIGGLKALPVRIETH